MTPTHLRRKPVPSGVRAGTAPSSSGAMLQLEMFPGGMEELIRLESSPLQAEIAQVTSSRIKFD